MKSSGTALLAQVGEGFVRYSCSVIFVKLIEGEMHFLVLFLNSFTIIFFELFT